LINYTNASPILSTKKPLPNNDIPFHCSKGNRTYTEKSEKEAASGLRGRNRALQGPDGGALFLPGAMRENKPIARGSFRAALPT
jgi:hypothetical protein